VVVAVVAHALVPGLPWALRDRGDDAFHCGSMAHAKRGIHPQLNCQELFMSTRERHTGRLIDHIGMVVRDFPASQAFYTAVFNALEIPIGGSDEHNLWADELYIGSTESADVQGQLTGRHHIAFQARDRAMVDAFYRAAMAHGGRDNGAPGERPYHPGYYAAFVLDPEGNNIEAVFHGEADRSAASVHITYR
jgi:catechol 2,3-dioxygenase-like lactoylglutathione lyase family enzyme